MTLAEKHSDHGTPAPVTHYNDISDSVISPRALTVVTGAAAARAAEVTSQSKTVSSATPAAGSEESLRQISVEAIVPHENQPRKVFDEASLKTLADSIRAQGVLQPILVRELPEGKFGILAGERRWQAARLAGLAVVPALVRKSATPENQLLLALLENLQREDLNVLEEARAFERMSSEFRLSHEEIASRVGRSRTAITNAIRILSLPPEILKALEEGRVASGQVRPLLALSRPDALALFKRIIADDLSAREVERLAGSSPDADGAKRKAKKQATTAIADVEDRLTRKFGRNARIMGSEKKGSVRFDYYSKEDLIQLVDQLLEQE